MQPPSPWNTFSPQWHSRTHRRVAHGAGVANQTHQFAFAALISASSMARSSVVNSLQPPPQAIDVDDIAEVVLLTRGVRDVTSVFWEEVRTGPMGYLTKGLEMPDEERQHARLPDSVARHFDDVAAMLQSRCSGEPQILELCSSAWLALREIYLHLTYFKKIDQVYSGQIWRWPVSGTSIPSGHATHAVPAEHGPICLL